MRESFISKEKNILGMLATMLIVSVSLFPAHALADGDAAAGKRIYDTRCLGCHGDGKATGTLGPSLVGIIGRKAATGDTGVHSRALSEFGVTWNEVGLRAFLAGPTTLVPGTTMPVGVPDAQQIDDLIAYLRTLR